MKVGVIQASSQADKNSILYETVSKQLDGIEVINFGCFPGEKEEYSYVEISVQIGLLLASHSVDFVITGSSFGQGMMLACNNMPGVLCGYAATPQEAFLFGRINAGNALSVPLELNFGYGAEINLGLTVMALFSGDFGGGYPTNEADRKVKDANLLKELKSLSQVPILDFLDCMDKDIISKTLERDKVIDYIMENSDNQKIKGWIRDKIFGLGADEKVMEKTLSLFDESELGKNTVLLFDDSLDNNNDENANINSLADDSLDKPDSSVNLTDKENAADSISELDKKTSSVVDNKKVYDENENTDSLINDKYEQDKNIVTLSDESENTDSLINDKYEQDKNIVTLSDERINTGSLVHDSLNNSNSSVDHSDKEKSADSIFDFDYHPPELLVKSLRPIDGRINDYDLIMYYKNVERYKKYDLPEGFEFKFFEKGDENDWVDIHLSAGEFISKEEGLDDFHGYYDYFANEIDKRCIFIVEKATSKKVATITVGLLEDRVYNFSGAIDWIAVRRDYSGKGFFGPLVSKAIETAGKLNHIGLVVCMPTSEWLAAKLFLDYGFEILNIRDRIGWNVLKAITNHPKLEEFYAASDEEIYDSRNIELVDLLEKQYKTDQFNFSIWHRNGWHNIYTYFNNEPHEYVFYIEEDKIRIEEIKGA